MGLSPVTVTVWLCWFKKTFHLTLLLGTYWRLLPLMIYIHQPCCKTWKTIINIRVCLEIPHKKIITIYETIYLEAFWSWFLRFLSPPLAPCYSSSARFPELVRPLFLLLDDFLCSPCDHSMEYFDKHTFCLYLQWEGWFSWFS